MGSHARALKSGLLARRFQAASGFKPRRANRRRKPLPPPRGAAARYAVNGGGKGEFPPQAAHTLYWRLLMADKRMFSKSIIESDLFIDMPVSARLLYYDLGMRGEQ